MPRRTKIVAIGLVVLLGVGAALVFRKSSQPAADDAPPERHATATRDEVRALPEKPAPVSHLTGRIDLGARAPAAPGTSPLPGAGLGGAAAPFSSGATLSEQVRHKIVDGDTLSGLAQRYLGRADRYTEIYELNRNLLPDPNLLPIGAELRIPPATAPSARTEQLEPRPMVPVAPRPNAPAVPQASLTAASGPPLGSTYRVERNDTLSGIAKKVYGDARRYHELLDANRGQLARPEDLREGMVLSIP